MANILRCSEGRISRRNDKHKDWENNTCIRSLTLVAGLRVKAVACSQNGALRDNITPEQPGTRVQVVEAQGSFDSRAGNSRTRAHAGAFPEGREPSTGRQAPPQSILAFPRCFSFLLIFSLFQCSLLSQVFILFLLTHLFKPYSRHLFYTWNSQVSKKRQKWLLRSQMTKKLFRMPTGELLVVLPSFLLFCPQFQRA